MQVIMNKALIALRELLEMLRRQQHALMPLDCLWYLLAVHSTCQGSTELFVYREVFVIQKNCNLAAHWQGSAVRTGGSIIRKHHGRLSVHRHYKGD